MRDRDSGCNCNQCRGDDWQYEREGLTPTETVVLVAVVLFVIFLAALSL